jgi:hypothetical protein
MTRAAAAPPGIESRARSVRREGSNRREVCMPQRIVESPQRARSARKPGIVRYILAVSLVLVVILFLVAYTISV